MRSTTAVFGLPTGIWIVIQAVMTAVVLPFICLGSLSPFGYMACLFLLFLIINGTIIVVSFMVKSNGKNGTWQETAVRAWFVFSTAWVFFSTLFASCSVMYFAFVVFRR